MQRTLTLSSGFSIDYTNMFGAERLSEADIIQHTDKLKKAHDNVSNLTCGRCVDGEKVLFRQLPFLKAGHINNAATLAKINSYAQSLKSRVQSVVSIGIGGSHLGAKVLFECMLDKYWNNMPIKERGGRPKFYFAGNNLDATYLHSLIKQLLREARAYKQEKNAIYTVALFITSKSGRTMECLASFMSLYTALCDYADLLNVEVAVITQPKLPDNQLEQLAQTWGWDIFRVPEGVGGRFCVFTDPGLLIAAVLGLDVQSFLKGAEDMDIACQTDKWQDNPAMLAAILKFLAREQCDKCIEVFMPYAESMRSVTEWYVQLLAESLGKKHNAQGECIHYSRVPLPAIGSTDMHAQTQEHQEGMDNKIVQFIKIAQPNVDIKVPPIFAQYELFAKLSDFSFNELNHWAQQANADALASVNRFNMTITLPVLDMYYLGSLMYFCMLSVAYEAELANINAYNQPGVEVYKKFLREKIISGKC